MDSCSPRSDGKRNKLTLLESVSNPPEISSEVINVWPETVYSRTLPLSSADQSSQFWLYAYTVGLSLSYLDNTSATAETFAFLCAAPSIYDAGSIFDREKNGVFEGRGIPINIKLCPCIIPINIYK